MKKACLVFSLLIIFLMFLSLAIVIFQNNLPLASKIALVRIEGPIFDSKEKVDEIKDYLENTSIKAIVLRVDSPGGAVAPSQEIYDQVKKANEKKKVIVSMGSIAASGGYYVAAPSSRIIANPGTITGSIGVILEIPNVEGLMDKIGIRTEVIKSGKHKDMGSAFRGIKEEERVILQGLMDNVHEQFIRAVAEGRKIDIKEVEEIADGRIFTGEKAVEYGLVDELGTLDDAINIAANLVGVKGKPQVVTKEDRFSFFDMLENKFSSRLEDVYTLKIKYLYSP
jgi:protease-4